MKSTDKTQSQNSAELTPTYESRGIGNGHFEAIRIPGEKLISPDGKEIRLDDYLGEYGYVGKFLVFVDFSHRVWIIPYFSAGVRLEILRLGFIEDCRDIDDLDKDTLSKKLRNIIETDPEIESIYQRLIDQFVDTEYSTKFDAIAEETFTYVEKVTEMLRTGSDYKFPLAKAKNMAFIWAMPLMEIKLRHLAEAELEANLKTKKES